MGREVLRRIKEAIKRRKKTLIFFLDYDGTLTPIKRKPHLAKLKQSTKKILKKLSLKKNVFIVSGRSLSDVKNLVGIKSIHYIGNHGIEVKGPRFNHVQPQAKKLKVHIQKAYKKLKKKLKLKGILVENKTYTLSVHYRLVKPSLVPKVKKDFTELIGDLVKSKKIKITKGKKVFEVRPNIRWHKGKSISWVLKKQKKCLPICIGDDITDEDAFKALGKKGISILVSRKKRKTTADYRVSSPKEIVNLLKWCLNE